MEILALACGLVCASSGSAATIIPVNNPSFEILPSGGLPISGYLGGDYSDAPIPDWVTGPDAGQFQPGGPSGTVPNGCRVGGGALAALATVRRSNCTCGFPACSFHEDSRFRGAIEG
ncbi:MAG: hypothetical protein ABSB35_36365, partial [Bryobacteraceae bacterium]